MSTVMKESGPGNFEFIQFSTNAQIASNPLQSNPNQKVSFAMTECDSCDKTFLPNETFNPHVHDIHQGTPKDLSMHKL